MQLPTLGHSSLEEVVRMQGSAGIGEGYPIVFSQIANAMRDRGLTEEGIFRIPGSQDKIQAMQKAYEANDGTLDSLIDGAGIHDLDGFYKAMLRDRDPQCVPKELVGDFLKAMDLDEDEQVPALKGLVDALPEEHRDLLKHVCEFCVEIVGHGENNKMNPTNLGVSIGPSVFQPESPFDIPNVPPVMEALIKNFDSIFG